MSIAFVWRKKSTFSRAKGLRSRIPLVYKMACNDDTLGKLIVTLVTTTSGRGGDKYFPKG